MRRRVYQSPDHIRHPTFSAVGGHSRCRVGQRLWTFADAARIDGASEFRIFPTMGVPLARGALSVLAVLTFLGSWNDFLWPSIVLRSPERQTCPVGLANLVGFYNTEYGMILAGSFLATACGGRCRYGSPLGVLGPSWLCDAGPHVGHGHVGPGRDRE